MNVCEDRESKFVVYEEMHENAQKCTWLVPDVHQVLAT